MSSGLKWEILTQFLRWIRIKEDVSCQPLASPCTYLHMYQHTYLCKHATRVKIVLSLFYSSGKFKVDFLHLEVCIASSIYFLDIVNSKIFNCDSWLSVLESVDGFILLNILQVVWILRKQDSIWWKLLREEQRNLAWWLVFYFSSVVQISSLKLIHKLF